MRKLGLIGLCLGAAQPSFALTVMNVTPSFGSAGTQVTITGEYFHLAKRVLFGGASASFEINSASQITAVAPAHAVGVVTVKVKEN